MAILEVIKYEGDNDALVWKHPAEDFNTSSTLIVHESQEAIFFKNGQIADVFGAGRYILKTENIPILRRLMNLPTGGESTFHCEVYFVNKVEKLALKWGTDSKVVFIEPTYNIPMEIGASGDMGIKIADSASFLVRLVGTETLLTPTGLLGYFRGILMTRVKSYLGRTIKEKQLNIFEIDAELDILSEALKARLETDFREYGITLTQFVIRTVVRPEDDPNYRRLKDAMAKQHTSILQAQIDRQESLIRQQTEADKRVIMAEAEAKKRQLEGYTYQEERAYDVASQVASNEGVGTFSNMGMGLGMMTGVGGAMGGVVSGMVGGAMGGTIAGMTGNTPAPAESPQQPPVNPVPAAGPVFPAGSAAPQPTAQETEKPNATRICPNPQCGHELPAGAAFCMFCGQPLPPVCPSCGKEVPAGAAFCMFCGHPLQ